MRITVKVSMPHLNSYNRSTTPEYTYECDFPVQVGDKVLVPPAPRDPWQEWTEGTVSALTDTGYTGPARKVRPIERKEQTSEED